MLFYLVVFVLWAEAYLFCDVVGNCKCTLQELVQYCGITKGSSTEVYTPFTFSRSNIRLLASPLNIHCRTSPYMKDVPQRHRKPSGWSSHGRTTFSLTHSICPVRCHHTDTVSCYIYTSKVSSVLLNVDGLLDASWIGSEVVCNVS